MHNRNCYQKGHRQFSEQVLKLTANSKKSFFGIWPFLGDKHLFGLLTLSKINKDKGLLNRHFDIIEEFSSLPISGFMISFLTQSWVIGILLKLCSNDFHNKALKQLSAGKAIGCFCLTEMNYGSSYRNLQTQARFENEKWVISGEKAYITNGAEADYFIVVTNTGDDISVFLLSKATNNIQVNQSYDFNGNSLSGISSIKFDNVAVDETCLLGKKGSGSFILPQSLQSERLDIALYAVATAKSCFIQTKTFLENRQNHKGHSLINAYQSIQHRLVDIYSKIEITESYVKHVASTYLMKRSCAREIMIAKVQATEMARDVLQELTQLHGAYGYLKNGFASTMYNNIAPLVIGAGANDVLRNGIYNSL